MINLGELRTGTLLNYHTAEGDLLPSKIDWHDLKWLTKDTKGFNMEHSSIPLTPEILTECCGFGRVILEFPNNIISRYNSPGRWLFLTLEDDLFKLFLYNDREEGKEISVNSLHHLQNLFYVLSGDELPVDVERLTELINGKK